MVNGSGRCFVERGRRDRGGAAAARRRRDPAARAADPGAARPPARPVVADGRRPPARRLPAPRRHPAARDRRAVPHDPPLRRPPHGPRRVRRRPATPTRCCGSLRRRRRQHRRSPVAPARARPRCSTRSPVTSAPTERIITIEETAELRLPQPHVVRLEARPANAEGAGAFTVRDLVRAALRMRPDRLVVGEVRGAEALDLLQALNTGHDGSISTVHANGPLDALRRLSTLALFGGDRASARRDLRAAARVGRRRRPGRRGRARCPRGRRRRRGRRRAPGRSRCGRCSSAAPAGLVVEGRPERGGRRRGGPDDRSLAARARSASCSSVVLVRDAARAPIPRPGARAATRDGRCCRRGAGPVLAERLARADLDVTPEAALGWWCARRRRRRVVRAGAGAPLVVPRVLGAARRRARSLLRRGPATPTGAARAALPGRARPRRRAGPRPAAP